MKDLARGYVMGGDGYLHNKNLNSEKISASSSYLDRVRQGYGQEQFSEHFNMAALTPIEFVLNAGGILELAVIGEGSLWWTDLSPVAKKACVYGARAGLIAGAVALPYCWPPKDISSAFGTGLLGAGAGLLSMAFLTASTHFSYHTVKATYYGCGYVLPKKVLSLFENKAPEPKI